MTGNTAPATQPKRSDYGALRDSDAADEVDNAYCTEYSLPDKPTAVDYLAYPYRYFPYVTE